MSRLLVVIGAVLMLVGTSAGVAMQAGGGRRVDVVIRDRQYHPSALTVRSGDTVVWTNQDGFDHTVVADDGAFASPTIKTGQSFVHRFDRQGVQGYHCRLHPRMRGTVTVE